LPGGCSIGDRPVKLHISGLRALGATVEIKHGEVYAKATSPNGRLQGAKIYLDYPSVGATETLMMAATLAEGETILDNAAKEPEIVDLANFCISMGAKIAGAGTERIVIQGVDKLHDTEYEVIPDRIEASTFLVIGAVMRSEISLFPVIPMHLAAATAKLAEIGVEVIIDGPRMRVLPAKQLKSVNIETLPYPGFPTDIQAQFMALLSLASGNSVITETVFENRLQHVAELQRMGANIQIKGNNAIIQGVDKLFGAKVIATDLRASAALVIAGLFADGITTIEGLHHLDRGYENLEQKLQNLGARIERTIERDGATSGHHSEIIKSLNLSYETNVNSKIPVVSKIQILIQNIYNNGYAKRFNPRIYMKLGIEVDERQWIELISILVRSGQAIEKLELTCPCCNEIINSYTKYQDIPLNQTISCIHCAHEFEVSEEHIIPMYSFSESFDSEQDLSDLEKYSGILAEKD
jgi:UDP-N-acetylglucosamine 1-carboxyvinyltransferase